jgi:aminopeptidase N
MSRDDLTEREAARRARLISGCAYETALDLTRGDQVFGSDTTVTFRCSEPGASTFIDFAARELELAELNGAALPADAFDGRRLRLDGLAADNRLRVRGTAPYSHTGQGLHFFRDVADGQPYLHTQFEPWDAHRVFACFDQPDLKATFAFRVAAPRHWVVVSNQPGTQAGELWTFERTPIMSTYLTAFVAGPYRGVHRRHREVELGLYYRPSLERYVEADEIFEITCQGLDHFERVLGVPYPFAKYDQLFVPEFNHGAMENIGCVVFRDAMLFRSKVPDSQRQARASTILHEMAHMWFGDLVTMRWWSDLWLNESFATFAGTHATAAATRFRTAWVPFAVAKVRARAADQLPTTHPIVARVPDIDSLHLNFDAITYTKGAAALRQLVAWVGEERFFRGVRSYLRRHAWGNAELSDFLAALAEASGRDLADWSRRWLETAGVSTLAAVVEVEEQRIARLAVTQQAPSEHPTLRPHRVAVGLYRLEGDRLVRGRALEVDVDAAVTELPDLAGEPAPDLVLINDGDLTFAKLELDRASVATVRRHLRRLEDPLARALCWGALWDMVRDARLRATDYLATVLANVGGETELSVVQSLLGQAATAISTYADPNRAAELRRALAAAARTAMEEAPPGGDLQLVWAHAYIGSARRDEDLAHLRALLDGSASVPGLAVDLDLRWTIVHALAAGGQADEGLIDAELARDPTDQGRRRAAAARAAVPTAAAQAAAWRQAAEDASTPLATARAVITGFHDGERVELMRPYVDAYFAALTRVWEERSPEAALSVVGGLYPHAVVSEDVVELTGRALEGDLPSPIRRILLEQRDAMQRALRARAFDASAAD